MNLLVSEIKVKPAMSGPSTHSWTTVSVLEMKRITKKIWQPSRLNLPSWWKWVSANLVSLQMMLQAQSEATIATTAWCKIWPSGWQKCRELTAVFVKKWFLFLASIGVMDVKMSWNPSMKISQVQHPWPWRVVRFGVKSLKASFPLSRTIYPQEARPIAQFHFGLTGL